MIAWIIGGGYVTAEGFGTLSDKTQPKIVPGDPQIPKGKEIFKSPLLRYGRFDRYTKLGCAGIALAARDAGLDEAQEKRPIGVVLSTEYESYASDIEYYQITLEKNGAYTSPNLFSYTLPGIVLGEMAIHFKMTGPTFIVGESDSGTKGNKALESAMDILQAGLCETMIAGWLDSPPQAIAQTDTVQGSVFVALTTQQKQSSKHFIFKESRVLKNTTGREITSILDLF